MCTCANPNSAAARSGPGRTTVRQVKRLSRDRKSVSDPLLETLLYPPCIKCYFYYKWIPTHTWKLTSSDLVLMSTCVIDVCSQGLQDWPSRCLHQSRRRVHRIINKRLGHRRIGCLRIRCTASRPRCPGLATRSTRIPVNFRWAKQ